MKNRVLVFLLLTSASASAATSEEILKTAWNEPGLVSYSEAVGLLSQAQPANPFSEMQFTYELGDVEENSREYGLRVYPKGMTESKAYKSFLAALEADERNLKQQALAQVLVKRYGLLARLAYLKSKSQSSKDLSALVERVGQAMAYNARTDRSQLKSHIKAKNDLEKVYLKLAEIDRDLLIVEQELKSLSVEKIQNIDLSDLVTPEEIRERIGAYDPKKPSVTSEIYRLDYQRSLAAIRYDQAQENKWLSYFEVSIKDDVKKNEKFLGLQVALKLPFLSSPDLGGIDKQARFAREKAESSSKAASGDDLLFASMAELKSLLTLHQNLKKKQLESDPTALKRASNLIAKQDPMLAVDLQRSWYETNENIADIELQIRTLYVQFLFETSALADDPKTNHFSISKKRIL